MHPTVLGPLLVIALAAEEPGPLTSACPAAGPIQMDGRLDEEAWRLTPVASEMHHLGANTAATRATWFRVLYTRDALWVGVECQTPAGQKPPRPAVRDYDGPVFSDESVELYIQPSAPGPYYHLAFNTTGTRYDGIGFDKAWNGDWQAACATTDHGWQAEVRLPLRTLGLKEPPRPGATWRWNVARNDRVDQQYATWAELKRGFHEPEHFGTLQFVDGPAGVGPLRLTRRGAGLVLTAEARAGQASAAVSVRGTLRTPAGAPDFHLSRTVEPGQAMALTFATASGWLARTSCWLDYHVEVDGRRVYTSPTVTIPAEQVRPARPEHPVPVRIGNAEVSLTFDEATGRLLSVQNLGTDLTVRFGPAGTPVLEIEAVRYLKNPRFFRPEDVQTLVPDYETLAGVTRREEPAGQTLEITHRLAGYIDVRLTVTVPPQGVETQWRIDLDNRLTYRPTQALVLHRVRYPCVSEMEEEACGPGAYAVTPMLMGQKIPEPGRNLGPRRSIPYIGAATMGWFDYYGSRGGLYFKVGDVDPLPQTDLVLESDPATRRIRLAIQRWALCWPGQRWTPGPCGLAVHGGDWHAAADLYRAWFRATFKPYPLPRWLAEADGYVMSGGPDYEFADFPRAIDNALATGIAYMQLWCQMTGGDISYHAYAFPNPYMGTEEELKSAIAAVHAKGGRVGVYLNFNTGDPLLGTFVRQPRLDQKIPPHLPRPALDYMKDNWIQQSLMDHAGSYSTWNCLVPGYLDGYWNTCPAADKWTAYYYYWVVEKWAKEYKLDVWYLDSCPVSRGSPCFAFDHGHSQPAPEGQAIIDFYRRLRAGAPAEFGLMQEYSSDRLLPYSTHALGLPWHPPFAHPEVVRYTLPEYPLFSGMCNGIDGLKQFYPGESFSHVDALERVFLIGNRYEFPLSRRPPELASPWQRQMVRLRQACREEMNRGDFLDTIGLGALPERVEARLFRRADRTRLAVTLLDRRLEKKTPVELSVDLKAAGVGSARALRLVTLADERPLETPRPAGPRITVTVPPCDGRVAAILIDTDKP